MQILQNDEAGGFSFDRIIKIWFIKVKYKSISEIFSYTKKIKPGNISNFGSLDSFKISNKNPIQERQKSLALTKTYT